MSRENQEFIALSIQLNSRDTKMAELEIADDKWLKRHIKGKMISLRVIPQGARDNRVPDKKGLTVYLSVTDLLFIPDELFLSLPA